MSKLKCIIHYKHLDTTNEIITGVNEDTYKKLKESKGARLSLGGEYIHKEQIENLPSSFNAETQGFHRQCYQKFTNAVSVLKRKKVSNDAPDKRQRRSGQLPATLFPDICMKCKSSKPITVKGKKYFPKNILTISACDSIKRAAKLHNDEDLLVLVADEDLIAREFKMHEKCYRDYTRICTKQNTNVESNCTSTNDENDDSKKRFEYLCQFVQNRIIDGEQSLSIKLLTEVYGLDEEDCRMRGKVKQMLMKHFEGELLFVTVATNEAQVVLSKNVLTNTKKVSFLKQNKDFVLKEAAKVIKDDIDLLIQTAPELPWPPTVESLQSEDRQPPESLRMFLTTLLHSTDHSPSEEVIRYVDSFSQDILYAVSKRKFLTRKHILLGNGLHSITGLKKPITILARLGHSCNYNKVQEIQTAQAELVQGMRSLQHPLPLLPADSTSKVNTFFWWDNFDCNKETIEGSVHTCHGVAFQEESDKSIERNLVFQVPKSKKRTISVVPVDLPRRKVIPHEEPASFHGPSIYEYDDTDAWRILLCWNLLRRAYSATSQSISRFVGWISLIFGRINSKRTRITFLPPIRNPITEYSTVLECIVQSQNLAKASNMIYTHITVDAGAAAKFYHILWNNPKEFDKVLIHLGDFHGMMEFFSVIGKIVQDGGFEEVVYQAGLCTSGGIKGVLSGKHYNRSWRIHECFAEAIERLFCEALVSSCPDELETMIKEIVTDVDCKDIISQRPFRAYEEEYMKKKMECLQGHHGKTAQFWMSYLDLIERLHELHFSVNTNDFQLRLHCWRELISLCFSTNKQNYARYGAYYCLQSENLDKTHPGALKELEDKGLSVCRNDLNIRQSIDGAGEQTFMKSSKTTGTFSP